jgi:hypothetical protein
VVLVAVVVCLIQTELQAAALAQVIKDMLVVIAQEVAHLSLVALEAAARALRVAQIVEKQAVLVGLVLRLQYPEPQLITAAEAVV